MSVTSSINKLNIRGSAEIWVVVRGRGFPLYKEGFYRLIFKDDVNDFSSTSDIFFMIKMHASR
jgi:hypothetical protein